MRVQSMVGGVLVLAGCGVAAGSVGAQELFPQPFVVEHHVVQTDADGSVFATEPVTDHYGGSWIVSVRPDGSRLVIDLARRELTEVRPEKGTYSVLTFDRFAELQRRLRDAERREAGLPAATGDAQRGAEQPELQVVRVDGSTTPEGGGRQGSASPVLQRPGIVRLRVSEAPVAAADAEATAPAAVEVWLDPSVRLPAHTLDRLAAFEREVLGAAAPAGRRSPAELVAAARRQAGGALPVRTLRAASPAGSPSAGTVEDVTTRLEAAAELPPRLLEIPEGLARVPHPLEAVVAWMEDEAELAERSRVR